MSTAQARQLTAEVANQRANFWKSTYKLLSAPPRPALTQINDCSSKKLDARFHVGAFRKNAELPRGAWSGSKIRHVVFCVFIYCSSSSHGLKSSKRRSQVGILESGSFYLHPVCRHPQEPGSSHIQGEVSQPGPVDHRPNPGTGFPALSCELHPLLTTLFQVRVKWKLNKCKIIY